MDVHERQHRQHSDMRGTEEIVKEVSREGGSEEDQEHKEDGRCERKGNGQRYNARLYAQLVRYL